MFKFKRSKSLYVILVIAICVAAITILGRINVEKNNKAVDVVLDYGELQAMVAQSDETMDWWLEKFKGWHVNKVALNEESVQSLMDEHKPVKAILVKDLLKENDWDEKYPEALVDRIILQDEDIYDVVLETESKKLANFLKSGLNAKYDLAKYAYIEENGAYYFWLDGTVKDALYTNEIRYIDGDGVGFTNRKNMVSSKLLSLNIGFDQAKLNLIQSNKMEVVPRTYAYDGWNGEKFEAAIIEEYKHLKNIPAYLIFAGKEIIGEDDDSLKMEAYVKKNNIKVGMIETTVQREFIDQAGLTRLVGATDYDVVRVFSVWPYIQNRYQYYGYEDIEEIENTLYRAVTERNIRVIYFKPMKEKNSSYIYITDDTKYEKLFLRFQERIAKHNMTIGDASSMSPHDAPIANKMIIGYGVVAAALILLKNLWPIKKSAEYMLLIIGVLGVTGMGFMSISLAEKMIAFGATVVFSSLSGLYILHEAKRKRNELIKERLTNIIKMSTQTLVIASGIAFTGAIMVGAILSDIRYLLEMDIYRGVKLSQLLPLGIFVVGYLAVLGYKKHIKISEKLEFEDIKSVFEEKIKIGWMILGGVVLMAGYIYMARTGHETSIQPSNLEMVFRNFLELKLLARPRTKEFLFAFPALMMCIYAASKRYDLLAFVLGLAAMIGQTSIINTFSHLRTPVYLSVARTGYSLVIGIIIGIIGILVLDVIIKIFNKLRGAN